MRLTGEETAAIVLAFAALRAQAAGTSSLTRARSRWPAKSRHDLAEFDGTARRDGPAGWTATARREAVRNDVR
jgi:hypothetical protein